MVRLLLLMLMLAATACSSNKTSGWLQQNFEDDLYYVSSGEASRTVEVKQSKPNEPSDPYEEYLQARKGRNSGISPYDYNETQYDRTMRRHADPFWSSPSLGFGLGGFWGSRSYMLYNPFYPPFFSMQPGISLGFGMGNGFYPGMGFGMNPWQMGGFYDPWMMSSGFGWGNPWMMNSWNSPWGWGGGWHHGNAWGGGWNNGWNGNWGNDVSGAVQQAPPRNSRAMGGALPSQPDLFNPGGGRRQSSAPGQTGMSTSPRNAYGSEMDRTTRQARPTNTYTTPTRQEGDRTTRREVTESRRTATPSRSGYDRPTRQTPSWTTPERNAGRDYSSPSRSGSSDRGSWTPSPSRSFEAPPARSGGGGGGGSSRPSGGNPGRPR